MPDPKRARPSAAQARAHGAARPPLPGAVAAGGLDGLGLPDDDAITADPFAADGIPVDGIPTDDASDTDGASKPDATSGEPAGAPSPSIQVIGRIALLIDALFLAGEPLELKVLSRRTGLHSSTAHRILKDLVQIRFVERPVPGHYRLGVRLLELGNRVRSTMDVRAVAEPELKRLNQATGQTVNLSIRDQDEVLFIDRVLHDLRGVQVVRAIGQRMPLHVCSAGKVFLAEDSVEAVRGYARRTQLRASTSASLQSVDALLGDLQACRARGYAVDDGESGQDVLCIAARIVDDAGATVAAVSLPSARQAYRPDYPALLARCARQISHGLGWRPVDGAAVAGAARPAPDEVRSADPVPGIGPAAPPGVDGALR